MRDVQPGDKFVTKDCPDFWVRHNIGLKGVVTEVRLMKNGYIYVHYCLFYPRGEKGFQHANYLHDFEKVVSWISDSLSNIKGKYRL